MLSRQERDQMKKENVKKIAKERMYRLIELAEEEFKAHPERSQRYIELIRKLSQKNKVPIPKEIKPKFCKKCGAFLKPGENAKMRLTKAYRVVSCLECNFSRKLGL
jgi:ribonuclease P protein subunit RPR2